LLVRRTSYCARRARRFRRLRGVASIRRRSHALENRPETIEIFLRRWEDAVDDSIDQPDFFRRSSPEDLAQPPQTVTRAEAFVAALDVPLQRAERIEIIAHAKRHALMHEFAKDAVEEKLLRRAHCA